MDATPQNTPAESTATPWTKIAGPAGAISVFLANATAVLTPIDSIRNWVFKTFGFELLEDAHIYAVALTVGASIFGLAAIAYWLYETYIAGKRDYIKLLFVLGSVFIVV